MSNRYPGTVPSPIRFYRLNETSGTVAHDSGSQGQNGTLHGGITLGGPGLITGLGDGSYLFDGSSGYVDAPTTGLPSGAAPWSMDAWIKMPSVPSSGLHTFVEFGTGAANEAAVLFINATGQICCNTYAGNNVTGPAGVNNAIYYAGASYDGTNLRLYVFSLALAGNGGLQGTRLCTPAIVLTYCRIGSEDVPADDFYGGYEQAVGIYSSALSSAQFAANFQAGIAANPFAYAPRRRGVWR